MPAHTGPFAVRIFRDPAAFEAAAQPFLVEREASHCLQLGLIGGIRTGEWGDPFMALVERSGKTSLVAMRTPPHNLLLSHTADPTALEALLEVIEVSPGGVLGPQEVASAFAEAWSQQSGERAELTMRQRIYRLERVEPPGAVPGAARVATHDDRALLEEWIGAFLDETHPDQRSDAATTTARWLGSGERELWLWQTAGEPVSLAGAGSRTPNGVRISAVYTPPRQRRRGFASALVAHVSQGQLDAGRKFCFLFTDLDNPTSNHIYRQLGYEPVSDAYEYRFSSDVPND